jgi:hypothetical protein
MNEPELGLPPQDDDFSYWSSKQVAALLSRASRGDLETRHVDVRNHNLKLSYKVPEIDDTKCLSELVGMGQATVLTWIRVGRRMPLESALRWTWATGVDLPSLFSVKLKASDLKFRPLPSGIARRRRLKRREQVPNDSTSLFLATLKLAAANPFNAPRVRDLEIASGTHEQHPSFRHPQFLRLINRLRKNERQFAKKERVWRIIGDVHAAAIKAAGKGKRLGRGSVSMFMDNPGSFAGSLARSYLKWLKRRCRAGDQSVLRPKRIPVDVRAYWSLQEAQG